MKSGNLNFLEPSGPLQACNGNALPLLIDKKLCVRVLGCYGVCMCVRACVCVRARARAQCQSLGFLDKIYIRDSVSTLRFTWPAKSNFDFTERKTLILLSVLRGLTPKSDSTNTVNTPVLITAFWEGVFCSHVLGHHLS